MGEDRIRHLVTKRSGGKARYYWQPSITLADLGLNAEALGTDVAVAKTGTNGPRPGTITRLFAAYQASDEFQQLKPRTRAGYAYYLGKIEAEFGEIMVRALSPRVVKTYYRRVKHEVSVT